MIHILVPVNSQLGLIGGAAPGKEGRNVDHICFRVEPFNEMEIRQHLAQFNLNAGSVESRYGAEGHGPSMYLTDPEGNTIELKGSPTGSSD